MQVSHQAHGLVWFVMVNNKNNTWRFCVDYKCLIAITRKDMFPMSNFDQLKGKRKFSTLDAKHGYSCPPSITGQDGTCNTYGLYEFYVMPLGLNMQAMFQRLMQQVLTVFSRSVEKQHLCHPFARLQQFGLKLHPDECSIGCRLPRQLNII